MKLTDSTVKKIRGLILFTIVAAVVAVHYRECLRVAARLLHIFSPFLMGAAIAFVLNVPMRLSLIHIFKKDTTTTAADKMARVLEAEAAATQKPAI